MKFLIVLLVAGAQMAMAVACGTIAAPVACSVNVNGEFSYTFSNFSFIPVSPSGGGKTYVPDDVTIVASSGGAATGLITFTKTNGSTNTGTTFFVNAGETSGVRFSYDVTLAAILPGTVEFTGQPSVSFTAQGVANGSASLQMIVTNPPNGESCTASLSVQQGFCDLPPNTTNSLTTGNLLTLFGGTGNATVLNYTNRYDASFVADTGGDVPEPSTWVMMGVGLAAIPIMRRRRCR